MPEGHLLGLRDALWGHSETVAAPRAFVLCEEKRCRLEGTLSGAGGLAGKYFFVGKHREGERERERKKKTGRKRVGSPFGIESGRLLLHVPGNYFLLRFPNNTPLQL